MARAATPEELLCAARKFTWQNVPEGFDFPVDAVNRAKFENYDLTLVCGSLYLIGYIKRILSS